MPQFRILHAPDYETTKRGIALNDQYFTVDTADRETIEGWKKKNPHNLTHMYSADNVLMGFIEILPLTQACGQKLAEQEILEEEITAADILPPEQLHKATHLYISGIAIRDLRSWDGHCCAATLASAEAGMIRHLYGGGTLQMILANPTTFHGIRIIGKFGLRKMTHWKAALRAGNDVYGADATTPEFWQQMRALETRYQRFIRDYPWPLS